MSSLRAFLIRLSLRIVRSSSARARRATEFLSRRDSLDSVWISVAAITTGLMSVLYAKLFRLCETEFEHLLSGSGHREFLFILAPAAFAAAWAMVYFFCPEASGSGIPQVLAANELEAEASETADPAAKERISLRVGKFLSIRVIAVKIVSSLICVCGGGAIGREGPTLQISASIFHLFAKMTRRFYSSYAPHLANNGGEKPHDDKATRRIDGAPQAPGDNGTNAQMWIASGTGAGLAAAFNTPLGGIVYVIEELGAHHFTRVRNVLLTAIIISGLVSQAILGDYLYIGSPKIFLSGRVAVFLAVVIGFVSGLLGAQWAELLRIAVAKKSRIRSTSKLFFFALACGMVMAFLIHWRLSAAGSGILLMNDLLFHQGNADAGMVAARFLGTFASYISGTAGGIFSPSLSMGAALGGWLAEILGYSGMHLPILLGMIGFLTGVTRVPFTSFILVMEMTNEHFSVFPMMVASLCAILATNLVERESFYEAIKERYLSAPAT